MSADLPALRDSLIRSLAADPLLIEAEEQLHSTAGRRERARIREHLGELFHLGPGISEVDRLAYQGVDERLIAQFRGAMRRAMQGGANLAEAEKEVLHLLGLHKVGEFRNLIESHLSGPAEVPERDLAIYVPASETDAEDLQRALREELGRATQHAQTEPTQPADSAGARRSRRDLADEAPGAPVPSAAAAEQAAADSQIIEGGRPGRPLPALNPVPMLTAALEAIGFDRDRFGFVLRYGSYAPEGRTSQFMVGGLGLSDLSHRLTAWLEQQGPLDGQVQVLDEGSGELTIYLLAQEAV